MKRITCITFAFVSCLSLVSAQDLVTSKLDSLFTKIENQNKGMGSISIFQDGKEIYQKSYGYADMENEIKNTPNTKFRAGSISKTFTATIIMKLIEENKLSLQSKLSEYYPQIPNSDKITITHLLNHTSGIFNFTNVEDFPVWSKNEQNKEQLLNRIITSGTSFAPGEQYEYSNSNYVLLTYIAEDVAMESFPELLNEIIVTPCGLNHTYISTRIDPQKGEAHSYSNMSGSWVKSSETDMSVALGAGYINSTAHDLNVFLNCLFTEKIVNRESLDRMLSLKDDFYGLGLMKQTFAGNTGYGHTGGVDYFQSHAFHFPESNLSISLVANGVVYMMHNIISGCISICLNKEYELPVFTDAINIPSEELDKYLGIYSKDDLPIKLTITKKENTLVGQATGQPEIFLEYLGNHTFQFEAADAVLEFIPEENKMILKQMGMHFEMTKE